MAAVISIEDLELLEQLEDRYDLELANAALADSDERIPWSNLTHGHQGRENWWAASTSIAFAAATLASSILSRTGECWSLAYALPIARTCIDSVH